MPVMDSGFRVHRSPASDEAAIAVVVVGIGAMIQHRMPAAVVVIAAAIDSVLASLLVERLGHARVRRSPPAGRQTDRGDDGESDVDGSLHRRYRSAMRKAGAGYGS